MCSSPSYTESVTSRVDASCTYRSSVALNLLGGRAVAVDTPVLLDTEGGGGVLLPVVVEGGEKDEVAGEGRLEVLDSGSLVLLARDSLAVGGTGRGPAGLGDDDLAVSVAASLGDTLSLLEDPLARLLGSDTAVEESVAVDSSVVADGAELGVVDDGNESVDSDDVTLVLAGEAGLGGVNGSLDIANAVLAVVDTLVTDRDGVDDAPVTTGVVLDGGLELSDLALNILNVEETSKDLPALALGGANDGTSLVAVGAVHADHAVAIESSEILADLVRGLAGLVRVVGRVSDSVAGALGAAAGGRVGRRGRLLLLDLAGGGSGNGSRGLVRRGSLVRSRRRRSLLLGLVVVSSRCSRSLSGTRPVSGDGVAVLVDPDHLGGSSDGGNLSHVGDGGVLLGVTVTVGAMLGLSGDDGRKSGDADESGLHVDCFMDRVLRPAESELGRVLMSMYSVVGSGYWQIAGGNECFKRASLGRQCQADCLLEKDTRGEEVFLQGLTLSGGLELLRADWNAGERLLECKACQRTWAHKGELERADSEWAGVVKKSVRDRKGRRGGFDGLIDFRAGVE